MKNVTMIVTIPALVASLAACERTDAPMAQRPEAPLAATMTGPVDVTEAKPTVTPPQRASSGRTVASLGAAAEPGLWLKTPLVTTRQGGRISAVSSGRTISAELIPIDGPKTAGSRLSLKAMQALGLPLSGLVEIDVYPGS